jgi:hypothetical protein
VQARELASVLSQQPSSPAGACLWLLLPRKIHRLRGRWQCLASKTCASIACILQLLQGDVCCAVYRWCWCSCFVCLRWVLGLLPEFVFRCRV